MKIGPQDVGDIGILAVHGRDTAVAVEGGELLLLSPKGNCVHNVMEPCLKIKIGLSFISFP